MNKTEKNASLQSANNNSSFRKKHIGVLM